MCMCNSKPCSNDEQIVIKTEPVFRDALDTSSYARPSATRHDLDDMAAVAATCGSDPCHRRVYCQTRLLPTGVGPPQQATVQQIEKPTAVERDPRESNGMFTVILEKPRGIPWAIDLNYRRPSCLHVVRVKDGPISNYNRENPDRMIQAGDWIEQVNELRGDSKTMLQQIVTHDRIMLVVRKARHFGNSHVPAASSACIKMDDSKDNLAMQTCALELTSVDADASPALHSEKIYNIDIFPEFQELAEAYRAARNHCANKSRLGSRASPKRSGARSRSPLAQIPEEPVSTSVEKPMESQPDLHVSPSAVGACESVTSSPKSSLISARALADASLQSMHAKRIAELEDALVVAKVELDRFCTSHALPTVETKQDTAEKGPLPPSATVASEATHHQSQGQLQEHAPILLGRATIRSHEKLPPVPATPPPDPEVCGPKEKKK